MAKRLDYYNPDPDGVSVSRQGSRSFKNAMGASHVDGVNLKTWTFSIVCALASFINVTAHLIASNFPGLGYPCVYYHLVDYDELNMTHFNQMHRLTPQLYLNASQIIAYVAFTEIAFLLVLVYYIVCWFKIYMRREGGINLNQSTRDVSCMGDSASCFMYILCMDTFQLYVLSLSFRLPSVIAFTSFLHFVCLSVYVLTMITHYQSYERWSFALSKIHPRLQGAVKFKTLIVNTTEMILGFATMVLAMSLCLGFGNNFYVRTGSMVFATLGTFAVVSTLYFIVVEAVLHRYMKVQVGYHLGTFFGLCGALYPILMYESVGASAYAQGIYIILSILFLLWFAFTLTRTIRFLLARHRRYKSLINVEETRSLRDSADS